MSGIVGNNFNFTYSGQLTKEIFYKATQDTPALSDFAIIDNGVKFKKQYPLLGSLSKIVKPYTGYGASYDTTGINITNATLETKMFQVRKAWNIDQWNGVLDQTFNYMSEDLKDGVDMFDPSGTFLQRAFDHVVEDAVRRDTFRRIFFAAQDSSDDDYNTIDGFWTRLIDTSGASNYCVRRAGSSMGIGTLSAGAALAKLEEVYDQSNELLKAIPSSQKKFFVTGSVWDNYYNSLIGNGAVTEAAFQNLQKGMTSLTYKGIEIVPVRYWDTLLLETDNPLYGVAKHLILYTTKDNHRIGVENAADLNKIESQYVWKDEIFYMKGNMKYGYQYLHCDLQTIAY
jgi:hypothetical protein